MRSKLTGLSSRLPALAAPLLAVGALAASGVLSAPAVADAATRPSGQFGVDIHLTTRGGGGDSAFCRTSNAPGAFGATVTVVCSTGAVVEVSSGESGMPWVPMHGGAYRYLVQVRRADEVLATVDSYAGAGTVTSWRVVRMAERDYVELTVGW